MKKVFRIAMAVTLILCLALSALASNLIDISDGSTQWGRVIMELELRAEPSTHAKHLGFYSENVGDYVKLSGRYWDDINEIWWIRCKTDTGYGDSITGWTGLKRFDDDSFDLYDLPEYFYDFSSSDTIDFFDDDDKPKSSSSTVKGIAIKPLSLRSGPSNDTKDLGTYDVAGERITLSGRSWDKKNKIWWLECTFVYQGTQITGWTGAQRFDDDSFDIDDLQIYNW